MAKKSADSGSPSRLAALRRGAWLFPVVLLVIVLILALFRVSGSSVGYYNQLFGTGHDANLLYGQPRAVRSDEWLVTTPMTVAQWRSGFSSTNEKIGDGVDMAAIFDVPYRDWSALFRPQNLSFFVLPLENAFAFKWWLLGGALAAAAYFLTLTLLPGRKVLAALLGLGLLLSPFVQWWYQSITIAPLVYSMTLVALFALSLRARALRTRVLIGAGMAYTLTCFALILYPPFQIPCAIVAGALGLGLWLERKLPDTPWKSLFKLLLPSAFAVCLAALIITAFWLEHAGTIRLIQQSAYPGHRVATGGFGLVHLMDGFIDNRLQFETAKQHYHYNQSEASNFIFLWPILLLPSLLLAMRRWQKSRQIDWSVLLIGLVLVLFTADLFVRLPGPLLSLTGLGVVPHSRLLIGFGLANLVLILLLLRQLEEEHLSRGYAILAAAAAFVLYLGEGLVLHYKHAFLVPSLSQVAILAATVAVICFLFLKNRPLAASLLLLCLSLYSVYRADPLYVGLGPLTSSKLVQSVRETPQAQQGRWVDLDDFYWVNVPAMSGVSTLSATYPYPQLAQWRTLDPARRLSDVYNRYGSAIFTERPLAAAFVETAPDQYFVKYDPCSRFGAERRITHVLAQQPVSSPCLRLERRVQYPARTFYIYRAS